MVILLVTFFIQIIWPFNHFDIFSGSKLKFSYTIRWFKKNVKFGNIDVEKCDCYFLPSSNDKIPNKRLKPNKIDFQLDNRKYFEWVALENFLNQLLNSIKPFNLTLT